MKRKILAGLLSLCMMVSLVPTAVFAEETTPVEPTTQIETPAEEPVVASLEEETPAPVAKVNETGYATLTEALAAAKTMAGEVVVEIYNKVTFAEPLLGSYNSIKFVGKGNDAEIYLDVQGYTTATGKKVAFENLKLSKSEGGFVTNAGFMNVAFGIYDVTEVTYTNCVFVNGACASSGKVTFTGCTFYRSHDRYGMWAYGDVDVTVDGCTFADIRGIKMFSEGLQKTAAVTVKNTDFSAVTDKPAIVLTSGENVVLENNTYNAANGVLELDLAGVPNGTPVTSDVPPTCVNDNGACGVLVDGKIYTTVAQAAEVAASGSEVALLHNSTETVEFPAGVELNKNGFEAAGVTVATPVAEVNDKPYETLADAFAEIGKANGGDVVINILADEIDMSAWQGYSWNSYNASGANNVTVNGNGVKLTKMTKPLFLGTWTGKTLAINDITISEPAIVLDENDATGNTAVGAFVANVSCNESTVLTNCNVIGGSVTGGHWTGGLIGYAAGYSNQNDGPVFTTVTINDCTVEGVTISGKGSAGGIVGHATGDAWTKFDVQYATVTGNTITSTGSDTNKAGSIIGTIGAAGQPVFGKTGGVYVVARTSGNTVKSNNTAITTIYGRQGTSTGVLTVADGGYYEAYPVANDAYIADGCYVEKYYMDNGIFYEVCKMDNIINTEAELKAALDGDAKTIKIECVEDQFALFTEGEFTVDREVIIDLNGEKIIWGNGDVKPEENNGVFHVVAGGKLTIIDSVGGGEILVDGTAKDDYAMAIWADGGEVIINAGIIRNNCGMEGEHTSNQYDLIYVKNGGKITINDGTFECWTPEWTLNKHDKTEGTIVVNGGRFLYDYDPSCSTTENPTADFVAAGKHVCVVEGIIETDMGPETILYNEVHGTTTVAEKAATCGGTGTKAHYTCAAGTLFSDAAGKNIVTAKSLEIPATGHSFGGWTTTKGATCARNGEETRTCACGAAEVRETGKSSMHGYGADGKCATCGAADPNYVAPVATPAPTAAPTAKPTTAPAATPAPTATPEATPAPEMPKEADTTITEVVVKEEVVEAVKETVTVTEGTATVEKATVEAVIEATEEDAPVVLPLAQVTEETAEVVNKAEVATEALETVAEAEKDVVIELTDVTVMLDAEAVKAITEQADGETIEIRAVKTETHTLTEKQQATLADKDTAIVVTAQIFSDGEYIGDFKGGKATIMLPFQPEEGRAAEDYAVYFIDDHGELVAVPAEYVDGHMVFTTVHFSDYVIVYEGEAFGGSTEIVVPEAPVAESGFPVLPIAIVIAIIIIGGVIILMKKKNAEE